MGGSCSRHQINDDIFTTLPKDLLKMTVAYLDPFQITLEIIEWRHLTLVDGLLRTIASIRLTDRRSYKPIDIAHLLEHNLDVRSYMTSQFVDVECPAATSIIYFNVYRRFRCKMFIIQLHPEPYKDDGVTNASLGNCVMNGVWTPQSMHDISKHQPWGNQSLIPVRRVI